MKRRTSQKREHHNERPGRRGDRRPVGYRFAGATTLSGAVAGASVGIGAGPSGILAGLALGLAAGFLSGKMLDWEASHHHGHDEADRSERDRFEQPARDTFLRSDERGTW
jgi:hypothetical protein